MIKKLTFLVVLVALLGVKLHAQSGGSIVINPQKLNPVEDKDVKVFKAKSYEEKMKTYGQISMNKTSNNDTIIDYLYRGITNPCAIVRPFEFINARPPAIGYFGGPIWGPITAQQGGANFYVSDNGTVLTIPQIRGKLPRLKGIYLWVNERSRVIGEADTNYSFGIWEPLGGTSLSLRNRVKFNLKTLAPNGEFQPTDSPWYPQNYLELNDTDTIRVPRLTGFSIENHHPNNDDSLFFWFSSVTNPDSLGKGCIESKWFLALGDFVTQSLGGFTYVNSLFSETQPIYSPATGQGYYLGNPMIFPVLDYFDSLRVDATATNPVYNCVSGSCVQLRVNINDDIYKDAVYQWFPADGLSSDRVKEPCASPLATTTYTVRVTSETRSKGRQVVTDTITVFATGASIPLNFTPQRDTIAYVGEPFTFVNLTPNPERYDFKWSFGVSGRSSTEVSPTFSFPRTGRFTITLEAKEKNSNCGGRLTRQNVVQVVVRSSRPAANQSTPFKLYPNPIANGLDLMVAYTGQSLATYQLYNLNGQSVLTGQLMPQAAVQPIRIDGLVPGIYQLQINDGDKPYYQKIVVN